MRGLVHGKPKRGPGERASQSRVNLSSVFNVSMTKTPRCPPTHPITHRTRADCLKNRRPRKHPLSLSLCLSKPARHLSPLPSTHPYHNRQHHLHPNTLLCTHNSILCHRERSNSSSSSSLCALSLLDEARHVLLEALAKCGMGLLALLGHRLRLERRRRLQKKRAVRGGRHREHRVQKRPRRLQGGGER